jgi:hypothetical protein
MGRSQLRTICSARNPERERAGYPAYFYVELADGAFGA